MIKTKNLIVKNRNWIGHIGGGKVYRKK